MIALGQFLEVLIGGLMSGVLYSLVALGFVLIFKASGVFNFAQGAMVSLLTCASVSRPVRYRGTGALLSVEDIRGRYGRRLRDVLSTDVCSQL